MKKIKTHDAVGHTLCHDVTQIIKGEIKDALFRKGHVITESDVPTLLYLGKDHIYVWEDDPNMLHENDAAKQLIELCINENMHATEPKEGRIDLKADMDGLLVVDSKLLNDVNLFGELMISTRPSGSFIKRGEKLCGTRIIPLTIEKEKIEQVRKITNGQPLLKLLPIKSKKYAIITTGNELFYSRKKDTFTPVVKEKLGAYGCEMVTHVTLEDNHEHITTAIKGVLDSGAELVLCTGGMSVDPDDNTPLAIKNAAHKVVSYGAPMLPGSMFMLAYMKDGRAICGLPGCVMYSKYTIFDIVLPRLLADIPVTPQWFASLGDGGLCLECDHCHFPNCTFWKGCND